MSTPAEPHSSALLTPIQRRVVLVGMMGGQSLAAIDQMVLSTAVGSIAGELGNIAQAPWIFTANLLASASSMPIWGKLGDLYGRRRVFQLAILIFIGASLLAANAGSMIQLLACRALQGLGGGALLTMPYAIIGDIVRPRERPAYVAFISVVWTTAGFVGPPLGGFLVEGPGWRWMFYLNVPMALLALALIKWGYRIPRQRIEHRIDFAGAALLFSAVGSLILYTSWAGDALGWISAHALLLLGLSFGLGLLFLRQERRADEPIVELGLLRMHTVWPPLLATCIFGFANFVIAFFLPLYSIVVRGTSTVKAGFALAPLTAGLLIAGIVIGRRAARTQRYRRYASAGLVVYIVGLIGLALADSDGSLLVFWGCSLMLGIGSGMLSPMVIASLQNSVDERFLGIASSLPGFARAVAQTIGTSALGAFFALRLDGHLRADALPITDPPFETSALLDSPAAIRTLAEPLKSAVIESYRAAFSESFVVMLGIIGCSLVATRFMMDPTHGGESERVPIRSRPSSITRGPQRREESSGASARGGPGGMQDG